MRASSLFLSSSISKKCLLRLLSSSESFFSSFSAALLLELNLNISVSQLAIISMRWASFVTLSFLDLTSALAFSSLILVSLFLSWVIKVLKLSSSFLQSRIRISDIYLLFLAISSISLSLLLFTSRIWLFSLSISSFLSSACFARSSLSFSKSFSQMFFVFSSDSIRSCSSSISLVCDSSSSAAVANIFCMIILQFDSPSWILAVQTFGVELTLRLLISSRQAGFFSTHLRSVLKVQAMSFFTLSYSLSFYSSICSPSLICCSS